MSADDVQSHLKTYMAVFGALLVLTVITVGVSYLDVGIGAAVAIALAVAMVKGSLVGAFFMHLNHEVKVIYQVLALTVVFFAVLMTVPTSWWADGQVVASVWDQPVPESRMNAGHHGGHGSGDTHGGDGEGDHGGH